MHSANDILTALARSSGVSVTAIRYGSGARSCVHARQVGAWLLRNALAGNAEESPRGPSFNEVGVMLGRHHHATIMHSCKRVEEDIRTAGPRFGMLLRFIETTREK